MATTEEIDAIGLYMADTATWRNHVARMFCCACGQPGYQPQYLGELPPAELKRMLRKRTRCIIKGRGRQPQTLSVPLCHHPRIRISDHGRWQTAHFNALQTLYSRTPYAQHLLPLIEPLYKIPLPAEGIEFFQEGQNILEKWLNLEENIIEASTFYSKSPLQYSTLVADARMTQLDTLWIGELLLLKGKQSIWSLLPEELPIPLH